MTGAFVITAKAFFYVGCLLGIGSGSHHALGIAAAYRWLWVCGLLVLLALAVRLFALNVEIAGGLANAFDVSMFGWVWPRVKTQTLTIATGGVFLILAAVMRRTWPAALGSAIVAIGFGLAGHSQGQDVPAYVPFLVIAHVAIAGFWFVAPLNLWPRHALLDQDLKHRMHRFTRAATFAVPLMVLLGLWLAFIIAGSVSALFSLSYGRLLLLKLGAITLALCLGALNKFRLTSQLEAGDPRARSHLRFTLSLEFFLFSAAIVAIAAATTVFGPHAGAGL